MSTENTVTESTSPEGFEGGVVEATIIDATIIEGTVTKDMTAERRGVISSFPAKVVAFFALTIMAAIVLVGAGGVDFLIEGGFYTQSLDELSNRYLDGFLREQGNQEWSASSGQSEAARLGFALIKIGFSLRYWIYAIIFLAAVLTIVSFIFLLCGAGHRRGSDKIEGFALGVPFDLLTCGFVLLAYFMLDLFGNSISSSMSDPAALLVLVACFIIAVVTFTGWCMAFAARVKNGSWWRGTVICRVAVLSWRLLKACGRALMALARGIPLIGKTVLGLAALTLAEFFVICLFLPYTPLPGELLLLWLVEKLLVTPAVLYLALMLRTLQKGGAALATGDLSHHIDTRRMFGDFRKHAEHLNNIASGMAKAVDERVRSERLKTELITNVSHDIKTPLTSIINYTDLICREHCENERITEYAEVLHRQSGRLHRLLEGLIEASRASTGNVEVVLAPCEVSILLVQAVGEYEQHARASGLELVTRQPEYPVRIMADGRHLWRVFDNLMNNVCKYSQSGTRVYLTVEEEGGLVSVSFKNTSRYPLDISPQELLERFVRGDSSRSAEGSEGTGLGLSIAQSLTELQGGRLELAVDGDLFKAILRFRSIPNDKGIG